MGDVLVGRQPILDSDRRLFGYELLFRDDGRDVAEIDPQHATCQVIANTLLEIGLDELVGGSRAFINVTRSFLDEGWYRLLPPARTVLEVLETESVDEALLSSVARARAEGYLVAADDITFLPHQRPLVDAVDIVKVDLLDLAARELALVSEWRAPGSTWLAEKVETAEEESRCQALGFELYQGYHFTRPEVLTGHRPGSSRVAVLQLLTELAVEQPDVHRLAEVIEADPTLTYKLLTTVNSGLFALPAKITSVRSAVVLMGTVAVRQLALLLTMGAIDDKPNELVHTALVRARMCERVAASIDLAGPTAFTIGLLSLIDAFLDQPIELALADLPLSDEVQSAIIRRHGGLGVVLDVVIQWERGDSDAVASLLGGPAAAAATARSAMTWATSLVHGPGEAVRAA